ncbi:sister-chromatid cohesion protein 3-like, partial [Phalaenopsis equestris]|uniref:sister-chromatid cohesion protein 3-like n=1 Tax=Phalaenopsis equestris TaxID=78828 RepID=UPI0009E39DA2
MTALAELEIVKYNGKLIPYAVKKLVERYETDPKSALVDILMLLFEACGAKYQFHVDSIESTDVDNVVVKLVELANAGEVEDLYTSKRKELKNFKENLALFWDTLVLECQNGPLFDNILFDKCMDYVIALSCTPPRIYRHVATLVGLQLVTSLIAAAKILAGQRETTQRQLNAEKKKRSDGPRVDSLNKRLTQTHKVISVIEEMMRKLFQGLFMHRYRDVDSDIRVSCIRSLGVWILSYPSLFLQDLYLKYLGWTLNDKVAAVRKTSVLSLQNLYEVDDNVPSLGLFTERFCNRMIELADDIDISVAVSAIGLLKLLLRHQLLTDEELGPLYDLLVDDPPLIRRAIGELVYDHLIAQNVKGSTSVSKGEDDKTSEVHLGRMLQILREFPDDPILSAYVIDDIWDDMKAMKDWKCMISMLLDESPGIEVTDVDATNLVRLLNASAKKAVGEKIVPSTDNRKPHYTKAQKEALDNNRREITAALMKSYPQLLQKFIADKAKLPALVEILLLLNLELYSLKRREQSFKSILDLIAEAFFKHGEEDALKSCIKALIFCSTESQADLQDYAKNKLKDLENELLVKLKAAIKAVKVGDDEYSLLVNLKRLYEVQLKKNFANDDLYDELASILRDVKGLDDEVLGFVLLNMYLQVAWSLYSIDGENPSEVSLTVLLSKRTNLFEQLEHLMDSLVVVHEERRRTVLPFRVSIILAEMWNLFKTSKYASTKLESLGYCPDLSTVQKFWKLCEQILNISDETEDEFANEEYIEETNKDAVLLAAAKLVINNAVSRVTFLSFDLLGAFINIIFGYTSTLASV